MKITLYNAISIDGFIATKDGDSDWVSEVDFPLFDKAIQDAGCIIVGRKTFEQYESELYPIEGVKNLVLTSDPNNINKYPNVISTNSSPDQAVNELEKIGQKTALLVGGGTTNASFLKAGLIDEIILSIHPLILGDGIRLFEAEDVKVNLQRIETKELADGLVQIKYKHIK